MRHHDHIDRALLRATLGLVAKLPPDYEAKFENVDVPLGLTYVEDGAQPIQGVRDGRPKYRRAAVSFLRATVVVHRGPVIHVDPRGRRFKSSAHRIFIVCPHCSTEIPAGRWHQHSGTKACFVAAVKRDESNGAGNVPCR